MSKSCMISFLISVAKVTVGERALQQGSFNKSAKIELSICAASRQSHCMTSQIDISEGDQCCQGNGGQRDHWAATSAGVVLPEVLWLRGVIGGSPELLCGAEEPPF